MFWISRLYWYDRHCHGMRRRGKQPGVVACRLFHGRLFRESVLRNMPLIRSCRQNKPYIHVYPLHHVVETGIVLGWSGNHKADRVRYGLLWYYQWNRINHSVNITLHCSTSPSYFCRQSEKHGNRCPGGPLIYAGCIPPQLCLRHVEYVLWTVRRCSMLYGFP